MPRSELSKTGQRAPETRWRKPRNIVLCEPLGEGKRCIRYKDYLVGMCGKKGDPIEASELKFYDKRSKKYVKMDMGDADEVIGCPGCPIAAYYLLRPASSEWEGGEFPISESVNGKQLRIQNNEGENITVNNGFVEGSKFAKKLFSNRNPLWDPESEE